MVSLDSKPKNGNKELINESSAAATKKKLKKTSEKTGEISWNQTLSLTKLGKTLD